MKKMRPRSSYHNKKSYDDELDLVLELLEECRPYEQELIDYLIEAYERLCELYEEIFPFYFKDGVDMHKFNELLISLNSRPGDFETKASKLLDEIERETRRLEERYITAWLIYVHELTREKTLRSLGIKTQGLKPTSLAIVESKARSLPGRSVIMQPWCKDGKTYMDRIRNATSQMDSNLRKVITQGIQRGWTIDRMSTIFSNITGAAAYKARRLIRTETMAVYSKVTKDIFLENGIEYVEIIGDAACGGICLDYVGEAIPLKEAEIGDDLPPYHPNCACSFCAYTDFNDEYVGESEQVE